jgi:hypothetical protein
VDQPADCPPKFYFRLLPVNHDAHAEDGIELLEGPRRHLREPLTVIWDRRKIHSESRRSSSIWRNTPQSGRMTCPQTRRG